MFYTHSDKQKGCKKQNRKDVTNDTHAFELTLFVKLVNLAHFFLIFFQMDHNTEVVRLIITVAEFLQEASANFSDYVSLLDKINQIKNSHSNLSLDLCSRLDYLKIRLIEEILRLKNIATPDDVLDICHGVNNRESGEEAKKICEVAAVVFDELFADQQLLENEVPTIALKKRLTDKINKIKFYQAKFSRLLNSSVEWVDTASIYQGRIRTGIIVNYDEANPFEFLNLCPELFIAKMNEFFRVHLHYKVHCRLNADFVLQAAENTSEKNLCSKAAVMSHDDNYGDWFAQHVIESSKKEHL